MSTFEVAKAIVELVRKKFFGIEVRIFNVENKLIVFNYEIPKLQIVNDYKVTIKECIIKDSTLVKHIYSCLLQQIFMDIIDYFKYESEEL